jgi:hypothetical protein
VFHRPPAQRQVLTVFSRAPYVVTDGRALKQLTAETSNHIQSNSNVLAAAYDAELRQRMAD